MKLKFVICALLLLAFGGPGVLQSRACAPLGELENAVRVVDESAVIVWDAKNKTQHFIRSATLDGNGKSVGFIVPTPSVPKLAEVKSDPFWQMQQLMLPKVIYKEIPHYVLDSVLRFNVVRNTFNAAGSALTDDDDAVDVLATQTVGDFDATVLRATDARSLNHWLQKNGYNSNAAFEKWLKVYVQKRWVVTAFKIRKTGDEERTFSSGLVRMSFQTPRPFFPYREPQQSSSQKMKGGVGENAKLKKRSLRIFFFAPTRMQAAPGDFGASQSWPGKTKWADDVNAHFNAYGSLKEIAQDCALPLILFKAAPRMTVFEDLSTPRPGTDDVFFAPSPNASILPAAIVVKKPVSKPIYIELVLLAIGAVVGGGTLFILRRS